MPKKRTNGQKVSARTSMNIGTNVEEVHPTHGMLTRNKVCSSGLIDSIGVPPVPTSFL